VHLMLSKPLYITGTIQNTVHLPAVAERVLTRTVHTAVGLQAACVFCAEPLCMCNAEASGQPSRPGQAHGLPRI